MGVISISEKREKKIWHCKLRRCCKKATPTWQPARRRAKHRGCAGSPTWTPPPSNSRKPLLATRAARQCSAPSKPTARPPMQNIALDSRLLLQSSWNTLHRRPSLTTRGSVVLRGGRHVQRDWQQREDRCVVDERRESRGKHRRRACGRLLPTCCRHV